MYFTIDIPPRTKKNHNRIVPKKGGGVVVIPSKAYVEYERAAAMYIPHTKPISTPVNIKAVFYMETRRRVDLPNLQNALLDTLVKCGLLEDDNSKIVASMDGSCVKYDKYRPRTEVQITEVRGND